MQKTIAERLAIFDAATRRQELRNARAPKTGEPPKDRGWKRDDLYDRGGTR